MVRDLCIRCASETRASAYPRAQAKSSVKFRRTQYPHHKNQHIPEKSGITSPMQSIHSNVIAISDLATGNGNDATPFSQQSVVLTKQAYIELTWKANYWQAQHARSVEREAALTAKVASLDSSSSGTAPRPGLRSRHSPPGPCGRLHGGKRFELISSCGSSAGATTRKNRLCYCTIWP
jgi:hypothetical protein